MLCINFCVILTVDSVKLLTLTVNYSVWTSALQVHQNTHHKIHEQFLSQCYHHTQVDEFMVWWHECTEMMRMYISFFYWLFNMPPFFYLNESGTWVPWISLYSCVDMTISRLKHRKEVGSVQEGWAGLGRSETPLFWSKASKEEQRAMVVAVTRTEQERLYIKAVSQSRQGGWMSWGGVTERPFSWSDLWKIPQARLSFQVRSTYGGV